MQNVIERTFDMDIMGDVIMHKGEIRLAEKMRDVIGVARDEVIHADNIMTFGYEAVTKMASEKSGSAGDESTWHYLFLLLKSYTDLFPTDTIIFQSKLFHFLRIVNIASVKNYLIF